MKCKIILAVLSLVCFGFSAAAQTVSVGPRVGATFSKVSYTGTRTAQVQEEIESNTGMQLGVVANVMVDDLFSVQPELLYGQKGFTIEENGLTYSLRSTYLEVPVLAKIAFGSAQLKGFVTGGPTFGYWTGGEEVMKAEDMEARQSIDFDDEQRGFRRFETGASFGVGLAYLTSAGALNLDVRYGLGFSTLFEETRGDDAEVKNRVLNVSLAYLFKL